MTETRQRRQDIDVARGIGIFLILAHHVAQYFGRYVPESFDTGFEHALVAVLTRANIPTFMLLAGIVLALPRRPIQGLRGYLAFERKKLCRLMLPFVAVSLLSLLAKAVVPAKARAVGLPALINTAIAPRGGGAGHLWFLYCLMVVFLIWPLLSRFSSGRSGWLLRGGLAVLAIVPLRHLVPWLVDEHNQPYFELVDAQWYLSIFAMGYWYGTLPAEQQKPKANRLLLALAVLAASLAAHFLIVWPAGLWWTALARAVRWPGYVAGAFSILWVSGYVTTWAPRAAAALAKVGLCSYDIYLLHVMFVGHPLALLADKLGVGPAAAYSMFAAGVVAAAIVPMGMALVIRRFPMLAFVVLGVPMRASSAVSYSAPLLPTAPQPGSRANR